MSQGEPETYGDAARACAVIDSWLRGKERGRPRDWHRLLAEMHALLDQLCRQDIIASDTTSRDIIAAMVHADDMEMIEFQVNLLALRVQQLLAAKAGTEGSRQVLPAVRSTSRPPLLQSAASETDGRSRTILRL